VGTGNRSRHLRRVRRQLEGSSGRCRGRATIEAGSLDTGNDKRDQHLRSPEFFDVERHPRIVFTTTALTSRDGGLTVTGELAIGSSRVRLEIPVSVQHIADDLMRLEGRTTVSRKAAGVAWNKLGTVGGDAMLHVQLTLQRATSCSGRS
jgi:polyisoprenoid-binding protein YceI